jgi:hypothetical protein
MSGPYTVTITPGLLAEGEHKGHLEYLNFSAVSKTDTKKWSSVNTGTLLDDFRAIFGEWGPSILERLRNGETVELPRTFEIDEIRYKIGGAGND